MCTSRRTKLVKVSHDGLVQSEGHGEATVIVRYLDQQVPVRLAFIPARPDFKWNAARANNYVDKHVFAKLRSLRMNPSALCSDTEFLRRAYLDLLGCCRRRMKRARSSDRQPQDKRAGLIDALLERPEFADFWALKWADLLRTEEKVLDRKECRHFTAGFARASPRTSHSISSCAN